MMFLQRTRSYSFGEFRIENNNDIMKLDKQIGIWNRTNKRLIRSIVVVIACTLFSRTLTISSENMDMFNALYYFSKSGLMIGFMMSAFFNIMFESKSFIITNFEEMFDCISLISIMTVLAKYFCSMGGI